MYVYYYRTYEKAVSGGGGREKGGHVLRERSGQKTNSEKRDELNLNPSSSVFCFFYVRKDPFSLFPFVPQNLKHRICQDTLESGGWIGYVG